MRTQRSDGTTMRWTNTTGTAVVSGQVIALNGLIGVAITDIAINATGGLSIHGEHELAATSANTWAAGDILYWNSTTSMLTTTAQALIAGHASTAKAALTVTACVILGRTALNASIADAGIFGAITGSDSSLGINGMAGAASAGGAVPITGGAGNGAGNAGGAATCTGGAGVAAAAGTGGAGGDVSRTGGAAGGDTTGSGGVGGAANSTGGAGGVCSGAGLAGAGGAATSTGGAGGTAATTGTGGAGGSTATTSGVGGASGAGGTGGAGGAATTTGGVGGAAATTGTGGAGGSIAGTAGAGGASGAGGQGGVGGAASRTAGAGGLCTTTGTGGVGGAAVITAGAGGATGTTGTAGASGACGLTGGAGGAGGTTGNGGKGTDILITGGAGGTCSGAGVAGNGANIVVTPGAAGTTAAGTDGVIGCIRNVGLATVQQGAPATETNNATTTIAKLLSGILAVTPTAACALTLPTGTNMSTANQLAVGDSFDWYLINLDTAADANIVTVAANTDHTIVGVAVVQSAKTTTGGLSGSSSAHFRSRKTAATTWITYRLG